jgi:UDP-N-acetylmuramoylalanine--D-glutamate ligase
MELFFEVCPCPIFGITGSDGKTTTTTLTHLFLDIEKRKSGHRAYVGGNIGAPLLPLVFEMTENDVAVLELSSFQLQTMRQSPKRAIITNITPNHLNWHTDMDEYTNAKLNIYAGNKTELLTVNANDDRTRSAGLSFYADKAFFSAKNVPDECKACNRSKYIFLSNEKICVSENGNVTEVLNINDIKLPGTHNVENYMAAISATWGLVSFDTILKIAKTFGGVEHRLEFVREFNGVKYYNSSIDSSPTRTTAALSALKTKPIVICGGYDKHIPFEPLAEALKEKAKAVVLTGATRFSILDAIDKCPGFDKAKIPVIIEESFEMAVKQASALAKEGDVVLLSPACASFDAFPNFEIRGKTFKNIVNSL